MCEISKCQRRSFRDQDPPRIRHRITDDAAKGDLDNSQSTPNSPTTLQRASGLDKCFSDPEFFGKQLEDKRKKHQPGFECPSAKESLGEEEELDPRRNSTSNDVVKEVDAKVPSIGRIGREVTGNGIKYNSDSCNGLTNGKDMAPVLGVPPPPPPAPHMGPDGLILPRKPYNPCLTSTNHKDLRRELLFNQKIGKNVLNQKSELQRALEKQREAASRREAERLREESYKDDPRTALQRTLEQRAKLMEQSSQPMEQPNLLVSARAKLRPPTDSQ